MSESSRTYGQFCPVAKASEVFAQRWTPLILRELFTGARRFNEIHAGVPRMSRTLLADRLRSMERDGVVERRAVDGERGPLYYPTEAGEEFREVIELLGSWGRRWMSNLQQWEFDLDLLMTGVCRNILAEEIPEHRVTIQFDFSDAPKQRWWLVLERPEVELCPRDPGHEPDLYVATDVEHMTMVFLGTLEIREAARQGLIELNGQRWAMEGFPRWMGHSHTKEWEQKWAGLRRARVRRSAAAG